MFILSRSLASFGRFMFGVAGDNAVIRSRFSPSRLDISRLLRCGRDLRIRVSPRMATQRPRLHEDKRAILSAKTHFPR